MIIQLDIPNNLNKKLKFYKLEKDYTNLSEALINVLERFFKVKADDRQK